jgi:hypothetical protein
MIEKPAHIEQIWLKEVLKSAPREFREHSGDRQQWICFSVLRHFFGRKWIQAHILGAGAKGFLANVFDNDAKTRVIRGFRITDLAEMLYNLQRIDGFYECIDRMRKGQIESTYAELDVGKLLFMHRIPFRFVVPQNRKGFDYDFELTYPDGLVACADAKCKLEVSEINRNTVKNSLQDAREQLPSNRPGIAFVKIPPRWIDDPTRAAELENVAVEYLRGTRRLASVKFYVSDLIYGDDISHHVMRFKEISNSQNRFDATRNWDLFESRAISDGHWNGMPDHWFRLAYFPHGPGIGAIELEAAL